MSLHNAWLVDGALLRDVGKLVEIAGVLINGRFDFQSPLANAWALKRAWPRASLLVVDEAGHTANDAITREIVRALDRFAEIQPSREL
jgi:proline iminopeptidase